MNKDYILKSNEEFNNIIKQGRFIYHKNFKVFIKPNNMDNIRVGISIPKKLGPAVLRNYLKRQTKEIFRDLLPIIKDQHIDLVIIINNSFVSFSFNDKMKLLREFVDKELKR